MASSAREDEQVASRRGPRAGQPKRRTFTAGYKIKILERYDELEDPRERGALLRREGLYHSHIEYWRAGVVAGDVEQDDGGAFGGVGPGGVDTGRPGAFDDPGDHSHGNQPPMACSEAHSARTATIRVA